MKIEANCWNCLQQKKTSGYSLTRCFAVGILASTNSDIRKLTNQLLIFLTLWSGSNNPRITQLIDIHDVYKTRHVSCFCFVEWDLVLLIIL